MYHVSTSGNIQEANALEFASNGHPTALIYDYGQGVSDTTRWENGIKTERQIVEADGDIQTTTFFSNGYAKIYVFEDISDTRPWQSQIKTFDEAGNLLSTVDEPEEVRSVPRCDFCVAPQHRLVISGFAALAFFELEGTKYDLQFAAPKTPLTDAQVKSEE